MATQRLSASERKKQIAMNAADLFAKKGFSGVTTREIAAASGVNEAMIFRYFPTKEALYSEIIDHKVRIEPKMFDIKGIEGRTDEDVLTEVAKFLLKDVREDNTLLRLMLFSALEGHDLSGLFLKKRGMILFEFLEDYISSRIKGGGFRDIRPHVAMRAFVGMFLHYIIIRELFRLPRSMKVSDKEVVENFVGIFLNGVKK